MQERRESWWKEAGLSNPAGPEFPSQILMVRVVDALLPRGCFLCSAASGDQFLCSSCSDTLPRIPGECCPVCALPTPGGAVCGACLRRPPHFDASHAVFRYEFPIDSLIHALKYGHRLASADFLARCLLEASPPTPPDLIIPVPLAPNRLAERGFNQAVELARPLARQWQVPLELTGVTRALDTLPQASLPWKERAKNIRHAFSCGIDLSGKSVLVVDDVMTTGATLNELAGTLKACGAKWVANLVVARALKS